MKNVFAISREEKRTAPVFIVGEARSGSSILFRTLQRHSSFAGREENLRETSFIAQAPEAANFDREHPEDMRSYMLGDERCWDEFLASLRPIRPALVLAARGGRRLHGRPDWAWIAGLNQLVARSFLHFARQARGSRRVLEKTPHPHRARRQARRLLSPLQDALHPPPPG